MSMLDYLCQGLSSNDGCLSLTSAAACHDAGIASACWGVGGRGIIRSSCYVIETQSACLVPPIQQVGQDGITSY